jgi:hypothetical protein
MQAQSPQMSAQQHPAAAWQHAMMAAAAGAQVPPALVHGPVGSHAMSTSHPPAVPSQMTAASVAAAAHAHASTPGLPRGMALTSDKARPVSQQTSTRSFSASSSITATAGKGKGRRAPVKSLAVVVPTQCRGEGELGWHPQLLEMSTVELNDHISKSRMEPGNACHLPPNLSFACPPANPHTGTHTHTHLLTPPCQLRRHTRARAHTHTHTHTTQHTPPRAHPDEVAALKALRRRIKNRGYTRRARERTRTSRSNTPDPEGTTTRDLRDPTSPDSAASRSSSYNEITNPRSR